MTTKPYLNFPFTKSILKISILEIKIMKVFLCYQNGSVEVKWDLPFLPHVGEYISTAELLSDKEYKQLGAKKDYLKIINISWFLCKDARQSTVEILLE